MVDQLQKLIDKYKVELAVENKKMEQLPHFAERTAARAKGQMEILEAIISDLTKILEENK